MITRQAVSVLLNWAINSEALENPISAQKKAAKLIQKHSKSLNANLSNVVIDGDLMKEIIKEAEQE